MKMLISSPEHPESRAPTATLRFFRIFAQERVIPLPQQHQEPSRSVIAAGQPNLTYAAAPRPLELP